ncbi:hypothetical protein LCL86_13695 [Muricauda ruestringensis]|uniref:hypothetical protein n=1 Tax=Flagellimonas ruestringensis TaxID=111501 RepID=UPI001CD3D802|nr:hypothetical protein [Allomuricauda ruestringensis]MCA0960105.1 hypothetical protein [Allomuricauda ruestringensis]
MKYSIFTVFIALTFNGFAQLSSAPTTEQGMFDAARGGSPQLNLVMMELRNKKSSFNENSNILGSPYYTKNFVRSKVFYDGEFTGEFMVRYNAFNNEFEIKESAQEDKPLKSFLPDKKIEVLYGSKMMKFSTFINRKKETKNGYLATIWEGDKYKLYHKLSVKFTEGRSAVNSMVQSTPSRFTHFSEYYFQKKGVNRIDEVDTRKGKFLKLFTPDQRKTINEILKTEKTDLNDENDLKLFFQKIDTL